MAVDAIEVNSYVGVDGNSYTSSVANDQLTNEDFLKLLLTEMQLQDPTAPMDSQRMMDSQLQMSTIEANLTMSQSMEALSAAFAQSNLSNAANIIGRSVENGEYGESGDLKQFLVSSVESVEGEVYMSANEIVGYDSENSQFILSEEKTMLPYNNITKIY
jgi:flagellar basal-body rod modification protein FlgD